jgi:hypothetical protein
VLVYTDPEDEPVDLQTTEVRIPDEVPVETVELLR